MRANGQSERAAGSFRAPPETTPTGNSERGSGSGSDEATVLSFLETSGNQRFVRTMEDLLESANAAISRLSHYHVKFEEAIDSNLRMFSSIRGSIRSGPHHMKKTSFIESLTSCLETIKSLSCEHRDHHIFISRLGRAIDNNFKVPSDFSLPDDSHNLINLEAIHYLLVNGYGTVIPSLLDETELASNTFLRNKLQEFSLLIEKIKLKNPIPVFEWIIEQENDESVYLDLQFKLHKAVFRQIAFSNGDIEAINYAQQNFPKYAITHTRDVCKIMSSLVTTTRYNVKILIDSLWLDAMKSFIRCASRILKYRDTNELLTIINMGCEVIPALTDFREILMSTPLLLRENIPMIKCFTTHHSLFVCPILKELCTDENPPMRLKCGHAISKLALERLTFNRRLKCPYCPVTQNNSDAKQLYF